MGSLKKKKKYHIKKAGDFKFFDIEKSNVPWLILSFLAPLVVFAYTACPKAHVDDCGEYIFGPLTLSVIHPPGYPLYCILGKIFSFIPIGDIAWRINVMSGLFTALAALFLYLIIYSLIGRNFWAVSGAWLFAFSSTAWSQSVVAEVYGLNVFFAACTIYLLIEWTKSKDLKWLYLFSFIYGLSLANHSLMALLGPAYLIYILWVDPSLLKNTRWYAVMAGLFILGLTPYLYLPIRANAAPFLNWGNPHNIERFLFHVTRKIYSDINYHDAYGFDTKLKFFNLFIKELTSQFYLPLVLVGLFGLYSSFKKEIKLNFLLLYVFLSSSFIILFFLQFPYNLNKAEVVKVYFIPSYAIFAVWIAVGLNEMSLWLEKKVKFNLNPAFWLIALLLPSILIYNNFFKNNLRNNYIAYDYVKSILNTQDKNAIFFAAGDTVCFDTLYLQAVEGYRKDIKMYDNYGYVSGDYLGDNFNLSFPKEDDKNKQRRIVYNKMIDENYGKHPIYFWENFNLGEDSKYYLANCGILYKALKKGEMYIDSEANWEKVKIRNLNDPKIYQDERIKELLATYYERLGRFYLNWNLPEKAEESFKELLNFNDAGAINNAGLCLLNANRPQEALQFLERALKINPSETGIYLNLALAQQNTGRYKEAKENYIYFLQRWTGDKQYIVLVEKNLKDIEEKSKDNAPDWIK